MRRIREIVAGRALSLWFVVLFLVFLTGACGDKKSEERTSPPAAEAPKETPQPPAPAAPDQPEKAAPDQSSKPASEQPKPADKKPPAPQQQPAPLTPPSEAPKPDTTLPQTTPAEPPKPTPPATTTPAEPAQKPAAKASAKDVVVLTGSPLGAVRLQHKLHAERAGGTCSTCHHASKPEKPASAPQQACSDCHTKSATPPMKTKLQAAFHNPTAQAGTCIDCHKAQNAKGKKAPVKCNECHKKANG